jgi:hypothetical protein
MADFKEEVADLGEKAIGFASNLFKRGSEVARQQARIVALQTQIARLREDKSRLYGLMGQKVFALYEKGLVKNADLLLLCEQAQDLDRQVDAAETEIQQLRVGAEGKTDIQDTEGGIEAEPAAPATAAAPAAATTPSSPTTASEPTSPASPSTSTGDLSWLPPIPPDPEPPQPPTSGTGSSTPPEV